MTDIKKNLAPAEHQPESRAPALERIAEIEEQLFAETVDSMHAILAYAELDEDAEAPPNSWVEEYGKKGAWARFRKCKDAAKPTAAVPFGLRMAPDVFKTLIAARATVMAGKGDSGGINVTVNFGKIEEEPDFPVKVLKGKA